MIVVDTNIIGYLYLTSERSVRAERALVKDPLWSAPLLWRSELRNVLALYVRKALLSLKEAREIMDEATDLMQDHEFPVDSGRVLSLAGASLCSAYDCEFVSLAQDLNVPLVTVDKQLLRKFQDIAVSLDSYVAE